MLLFIALCSVGEFNRFERARNERIDAEEAACASAAARAALTPAAELPPPPPPPSARLDKWSRVFYANSIGLCFMVMLALMFRVAKPYEEAVLSGSAGGALLASCVAAAVAAYTEAAGPNDSERSPKRALLVALSRALIVFASWELGEHNGPRAAAAGVFLCLVGEAFSRPRPQTAEQALAESKPAFELLSKEDVAKRRRATASDAADKVGGELGSSVERAGSELAKATKGFRSVRLCSLYAFIFRARPLSCSLSRTDARAPQPVAALAQC